MRWTLLALSLLSAPALLRAEYDPLSGAKESAPTKDYTIRDDKRQRDIPIRVYLPAETTAAPVILFSHGLGGSRTNSPYLGNHWAARGYVVVFMQHIGSDESVWKDAPVAQKLQAMRDAASGPNFLLRVQDVPAVIDQLERWNKEQNHELQGRLDLTRLGMSGHSFGAITTQAVSGQQFGIQRSFTDKRIKAAITFSPSAPQLGNVNRAFGSVQIPWLLMTGTNDTAIIGNATVEDRLAVFPALPAGDKYQVVLDKGEHSAFSDRPLPGDKLQRNPNHHRVILALSTAFWDTYLKSDDAAKQWLNGTGPAGVLEAGDKWEKK